MVISGQANGDPRGRVMQSGRDGYLAGGDMTVNEGDLTINIHYPPATPGTQMPPGAPDTAEATAIANIRLEIARAKFLATLRPNFSYWNGHYGYDAAQIDKFLAAARRLASTKMSELQAYLATTPRSFKRRKGKVYGSDDVDLFMVCLDAAVASYARDIAVTIETGLPQRSLADMRSALEGARSRLLAALRPNFSHVGGSYYTRRYGLGYDIAQMDNFLETARTLASTDMVQFQVHLAMTPRGFKTHKGKGYDTYGVDNFMNDLDRAAAEFCDEMSRLLRNDGPSLPGGRPQ